MTKHKETETERRVIELVTPHVCVLNEEVTYQSTFEQLGLDSIDRVELIYEAEREFSITIPEERCDDISTVAEFVELIDSLTDGTL